MGLLQEAAKTILKDELQEIKNQSVTDQNNLVLLNERLAELELSLEDVGWLKLVYGEENAFSRDALGKISYLSRLMYLKNPLVNRGVKVKQFYVWGQGVTIKAKDDDIDKTLQQFVNDFKNRQELMGHDARMLKELELECDGNVFLVFFVDKLGTGKVRLRSIPFDQIIDIICNPEDAKEPWFYQREWLDAKGQQKKMLYPDFRYTPKKKTTTSKNIKIKWDTPIMHIKVGGFSDWKFGCSEVYASIDWAKAYKEFLEDWATITRAYARFAWKATVKGGKNAVAKVKAKFNTTWDEDSGETNPPPGVGSMAIMGEGNQFDPIRTAGATTTPESGRRLLLMVAAAFGLPETFFGDVSVGTLATATALDRPTELAMSDRQTFWKDVLMDIFDYVLLWAVKKGDLKSRGTVEKVEDNGNQIAERVKWKEVDYVDVVEVTFPPVIAPDVLRNVEAVTNAATLGGAMDAGIFDEEKLLSMLLIALGEKNIEQVLDQMRDTDQYENFRELMKPFIEKYFERKIEEKDGI